MKYGDWVFWNGKGDLPTGMVQAWFYADRMRDAEKNMPTPAEDYYWFRDETMCARDIIAYRQLIEPVREVRNCDAHYIDGCVWSRHDKEVDNMIISITLVDGEPDKTVAPVARWVE